MIAHDFTCGDVAGTVGCHPITVERWRLGTSRISINYWRTLRAFYSDLPKNLPVDRRALAGGGRRWPKLAGTSSKE